MKFKIKYEVPKEGNLNSLLDELDSLQDEVEYISNSIYQLKIEYHHLKNTLNEKSSFDLISTKLTDILNHRY